MGTNRIAGAIDAIVLAGGIGRAFDPMSATSTISILMITIGAGLLGSVLGAIADSAIKH